MSWFRGRWRYVRTDDPIADIPIGTTEDWIAAGHRLTHELRERYGRSLLRIMRWQLIAADGLMLGYATWGVDWNIPNTVMQTWLGATVVQIVGVVYVVVSHLFPKPPKTLDPE